MVIAGAGCSSPPDPVPQETTENLGKILFVYTNAANKLARPPRSLDELKPFLKEAGFSDDVLVSPHDGEPYDILWNVDLMKMAGQSSNPAPIIIAYEHTGQNGRRFVLTGIGILSMTDEEFAGADLARKR